LRTAQIGDSGQNVRRCRLDRRRRRHHQAGHRPACARPNKERSAKSHYEFPHLVPPEVSGQASGTSFPGSGVPGVIFTILTPDA
jgi:hypothetical protein